MTAIDTPTVPSEDGEDSGLVGKTDTGLAPGVGEAVAGTEVRENVAGTEVRESLAGAEARESLAGAEARESLAGGKRRLSFVKRVRRAFALSVYMLVAGPIHLGLVIAVAVLTAYGIILSFFWIGFFVLMASIMIARLATTAQRRLNSAFADFEIPQHIYERPADYAGTRLFYPLRAPQSWMDVLWIFVSFPIAMVNCCLGFFWILATCVGLAQPITVWIGWLNGAEYGGFGRLLNTSHPYVFDAVLGFAVGLISLILGSYIVIGAAGFQFHVADVLLSRRARDRADIERLTRSREAGRRAESAALRRLERDLHDGPQQRLVRLNMDLARAKRQAGRDPVKAQEILDEAMVQTRDTLAELRQLSRGIAPPVLVDRGLVAAVREAAARSVVPVSVHAGVPSVPDHVASAAYYVVAESLVNVNKHACASSVVVSIDVADGVLRLSVVDDGVGGADVSKGHGLVGLEERLRSVDGTLEIDSPTGGPTTIEAVIPCASS